MTAALLTTDTDGTPGSKPPSPGSKTQPGWIVQEVPSVGWVVKELPAEDTGTSETGDGQAASDHSKTSSPQPPSLPPPSIGETEPLSPSQAPAMLPGVMDTGTPPPRTLGRPRPRSAVSRPQSAKRLGGTISEDSATGVISSPPRPNSLTGEPEMTLGPESSHLGGDVPTLSASTGASAAPPAKVPKVTRPPRLGGNGKPASFDAFVVFALDSDLRGRDNQSRAAAVTHGLEHRGLAVCQQSFLAGAVNNHLSSSDEAHLMAQAAQSSACAVLLLTRSFIERAASGSFGDSCVAAFTLAKRLPNTIVVAMEPELVDPSAWGWNQVFARFSGRAVVDLSMDTSNKSWEDSLERLAWLLNPHPDMGSNTFGSSSFGRSLAPVPASQLAPLGAGELETSLEDGHQEPGYHCFVSHNWGKDSKGRDNNARVHSIARHLQQHGIRVFVHDWETHRYNSPDEAMVDGMRRSGVAIVFLTRSYIEKIEAGKTDDDCVAQFNLAKRAPAIIPVIMEPELVKTSKWGWNRVFAHLSNKMTVDLSHGEVSGLPQLLWTPSSQRMHASLELLQLRVRQEAAKILPKEVQDRPPPMISHIGIAWLMVACLFVASIVQVITAAGHVAAGEWTVAFRLFGIVAAFFWTIGFSVFFLWLAIKARAPPSFDIDFSMAQPIAAIANLLRATCALLWMIGHILELASVDVGWSVVGSVAVHIFSLGSLACTIDAACVSRGAASSFKGGNPFTISDLPGHGSVAFTAGSALMSVAAVSEAGLELAGAVLLFLGTSCYIVWLAKTPSLVSCYFEAAESRRMQAQKTPSAPRTFLTSPEAMLREAAQAAPALQPQDGLQCQPTDTCVRSPDHMQEP